MLRRPGDETRVVGSLVVRALASTQYENRLDGFARGVELMVQRAINVLNRSNVRFTLMASTSRPGRRRSHSIRCSRSSRQWGF